MICPTPELRRCRRDMESLVIEYHGSCVRDFSDELEFGGGFDCLPGDKLCDHCGPDQCRAEDERAEEAALWEGMPNGRIRT